jgi:hypothetical protein
VACRGETPAPDPFFAGRFGSRIESRSGVLDGRTTTTPGAVRVRSCTTSRVGRIHNSHTTAQTVTDANTTNTATNRSRLTSSRSAR